MHLLGGLNVGLWLVSLLAWASCVRSSTLSNGLLIRRGLWFTLTRWDASDELLIMISWLRWQVAFFLKVLISFISEIHRLLLLWLRFLIKPRSCSWHLLLLFLCWCSTWRQKHQLIYLLLVTLWLLSLNLALSRLCPHKIIILLILVMLLIHRLVRCLAHLLGF